MRESTCDPQGKESLVFVILGLFLFFVLVGVIACMVCCFLKCRGKIKQYKWQNTPKRNSYLTEKKIVRRRKFDAYVCYNVEAENAFVADTVLPTLEENRSPPFRLCNHIRDFEPGLTIIVNIQSAIRNSNSAIIMMSQDYVNSPWCTKELEECCTENMKDPGFKLFVIMMQTRDVLVNINQYESYVQRFLSSDKDLDRYDPDLFKKISHELSRARLPSVTNVRESVTEIEARQHGNEFAENVNNHFLNGLNASNISIELQEYSPMLEETDRDEIDQQIIQHEPTVVDIHEVEAQGENRLHDSHANGSGSGTIIELEPLNKYSGLDEEMVLFERSHMENPSKNELNLFETKPGKKRIKSWPNFHLNVDDYEVGIGSFATKEDAVLTKLRSKLGRSRRFDAFVSFHHSGPHRDFVFNKILPELEENHNPPFRLYIHDRDFELGEDIMWNIETAIKLSNSAIIVMSQGYINSKWCQIEFRECFLESAGDSGFRLIVIMMESEDSLQNTSKYMKKFIRETTYGISADPNLFNKIGKCLTDIKS